MNCSGKHAAMIADLRANGWPIHDRLRVRTGRAGRLPIAGSPTCSRRSGPRSRTPPARRSSYVAVDGCGAPILAISLAGLARSFGAVRGCGPGTLEARVADAFRAYPEYASGSTRDEAALMHGVPGLFCKAGAEGVYAVGLADGRGIALKLEDGQAPRPHGR